ncbi:hypothetical protein MPTK1_3g23660 [Marchantia polymorpha subsp. ruderalis]|uniref:Uncharacterized protein n=2 Tax=Marchantia polymorpha TaxID=3197 RepID=A0AAF6B422_MARPO|nr:hypothetical protein MARPO_0024s0142 [Marchantia polymorpha]PTQ43655.1 hypothetical protein MARPO_0024s0142 [Marchantia polymorpha]BBN06755.1 hypothetical protein Mp_3g23660 [Marchantia polymorpha subsp. ruderalis]BBN06756.1 hypothetical protein Mp_3g23660 [Marchantia polymorpha subsp. ruderalis]|eukprot:PTQ43654.1 hypothetical protein MARPO_0024s0142 [Marchantia polymorpha]
MKSVRKLRFHSPCVLFCFVHCGEFWTCVRGEIANRLAKRLKRWRSSYRARSTILPTGRTSSRREKGIYQRP